MRKAVRANIIASVENLQSGSPILTELVEQDKLQIIGAEYSFDSGLVDFYEEA
jgi:carbonic anhydrase